MGTNSYCSLRQLIPVLLYLYVYIAPIVFINTGMVNGKEIINETLKVRKFMIGLVEKVEPSPNAQSEPYGVNSPFTLPPFDSLPPAQLPGNSPPYCIYPSSPVLGAPPITIIPGPPGSFSNPNPNPPVIINPGPPIGSYYSPPVPETVPPPPAVSASPSPPYYEPSPPYYEPSPGGGGGGSGGGGGFSPPVIFEPPVVYPPPIVPPPPPNAGPSIALWCVVKPSVPDPIIQEAMNYACGSGADCASIQPNGACFQPNTLFAHASYAFNSYWQRTKVAGGSCSFGGTAMLVTVDPSYDGCHFVYF